MKTAETHTDLINNPLDEKNFRSIRQSLLNKAGVNYADFKKSLTPKYGKVWFDIFLGWLLLISIFVLSAFAFENSGLLLRMVVLIIGAAFGGYMIAYLTNFFHEAAHFNISKSRTKNDQLANLSIGILLGQGIKNYRIIHWEHHKNLGQPTDMEISYFESLSPAFILKSLFGIRVFKLLSARNNFLNAQSVEKLKELKREALVQLIVGFLFHVLVLSVFVYFRQWWMMAEWIIAVGCFYPLFNSLRQLLEHRSDDAHKEENYREISHGQHTRLFGNNPFQKSFGSAGFNKHLLHHLEPNISYTRLNDLQKFLEESDIGESVKQKRTSYTITFFTLFNR
ncbi:MAG: hypothetical protein C5B52_07685 [Bacteroidetes bacterium]|nr:MAG: hypothetical protein C5B52_07685 [Bacteroidota bacterium]